jgi:hypothetical protein
MGCVRLRSTFPARAAAVLLTVVLLTPVLAYGSPCCASQPSCCAGDQPMVAPNQACCRTVKFEKTDLGPVSDSAPTIGSVIPATPKRLTAAPSYAVFLPHSPLVTVLRI